MFKIIFVGIIFLTILGCDPGSTRVTTGSANSTTTTTSGDCASNGAETNIANNHGHTLTVSAQDINQALEKNFTTTGVATHSHVVKLVAEDLNSLKNGQSVTTTSEIGAGHTHSMTFNCIGSS